MENEDRPILNYAPRGLKNPWDTFGPALAFFFLAPIAVVMLYLAWQAVEALVRALY